MKKVAYLLTQNYQIYVITITGRQKPQAQLLAKFQAPFSYGETSLNAFTEGVGAHP